MNIIGFENDPVGAQISMVTHGDKVKAVGGTADVLIAEGRILGLPTEIVGTLDLPATVDIRVPSSSNSIQTIKMTARNFIGPDVLPAPGQRRTAAADGFGPVPVDDMSITFLQRGDLFKADRGRGRPLRRRLPQRCRRRRQVARHQGVAHRLRCWPQDPRLRRPG